MEQIQNEHLTVCVSEMGAELQSIKDSNNREYLWQGGDRTATASHELTSAPLTA